MQDTRLIFTNETSSVKKISLSNIFVNSNYEQLSPIGIKYFDTIYGPDSPLYGNILRMNMPNELRIPPLQKVMKYIAVPAINPENKNYSITIITGSDALSYDFIQEKEQITNDFIVYQIVPVVNKSNITDVFVLVENKGYLMQLHQDRKVLINESRQDDVVNVYFIIFKKNAFKFGSRTNIKFSSFKYDYQVEVHQTHSKVIKD